MSSQQATLADALEAAAAKDDQQDTETAVTREAAATPLWSGGEGNQCLECGNDLTTRQARVLGDNDGCVPQCTECSLWDTLAKAVHTARTRKGGERRL